MSLAEELNMLEPFGVANSSPLFVVKNMTLNKIISMGAGKHSKLILSSGDNTYQAVCFGMSASTLEFYPGERVDLLCGLSINEFRGQFSLQLMVQDIRLSSDLENIYANDKKIFDEIASGAAFKDDGCIIPSRADIAGVYKFFRYENMCGHTLFTYRSLYASVYEQVSRDISSIKLRFIVKILNDIHVCDVEDCGDDAFLLEVKKNAPKTNIELSETYRNLCERVIG